MLRTGRKLKPLVKKRQPQAIESISEVKLVIHIIRGIDIPIRIKYFDYFAKFVSDGAKSDSLDAY